eukprot:RCo033676
MPCRGIPCVVSCAAALLLVVLLWQHWGCEMSLFNSPRRPRTESWRAVAEQASYVGVPSDGFRGRETGTSAFRAVAQSRSPSKPEDAAPAPCVVFAGLQCLPGRVFDPLLTCSAVPCTPEEDCCS